MSVCAEYNKYIMNGVIKQFNIKYVSLADIWLNYVIVTVWPILITHCHR